MKRWIPHLGLLLGLSLAGDALFFSSSEEERIRDRLEQLENSLAIDSGTGNIVLRKARVQKAFKQLFLKAVVVRIPELPQQGTSRSALANLATRAATRYHRAQIDLSHLLIELDSEKQSAVAFGDAHLQATTHNGILQQEERTVSLRLDKKEGNWQIVSLSVSAQEP